jgi:hypothetical protein
MWPYSGVIDTTDRPLTNDEWSDALTRALYRKDADDLRTLFDHSFWHGLDYKPDWFHLYIAVQQDSRALVQLMVTHGAQWDAQQTAIAAETFGDKIKPYKYVLASGGMHIDAPAPGGASDFPGGKLDLMTAFAMDKRILAENEKYGAVGAEERKVYDSNVAKACVQAAVSGDDITARKIFTQSRHGDEGLDITPWLKRGEDKQSYDTAGFLRVADALQKAKIPLKPVALEGFYDLSGGLYALMPELDKRGILGGDHAQLRDKMWHSWVYAQEHLFAAVEIPLQLPPALVERQRREFSAAAEILCRNPQKISKDEAAVFVGLHDIHGRRHRDAVTHMDEKLMALGFFNSPAFAADDLRNLAAAAPSDDLKQAFNRQAQKRDIDTKGLHYYLTPKRFDLLLEAVTNKAYTPNATDTRAIVTYLHGRCKRSGVPDDVTQAMKTLRDGGASFRLVDPLNYMGARHPLLAKTMLDLDIVHAADIKLHRLTSKIQPLQGMRGMYATETDKDYARREFLYQVAFERSFPAEISRRRAVAGVCYQRLYTLSKISKAMEGIRSQIPKRPPAPPSSPRPAFKKPFY